MLQKMEGETLCCTKPPIKGATVDTDAGRYTKECFKHQSLNFEKYVLYFLFVDRDFAFFTICGKKFAVSRKWRFF